MECVRDGLRGAAIAAAGELIVDGTSIPLRSLYRADELLRSLDERGIDIGCVSIPPPLYRQGLAHADCRTWTQAINSALEDLVLANSTHLRALAHLPIEHPDVAVAEVHSRSGRAFAGFAIASHATGVMLADPALRGLWESLDERSAFVFVHPAEPEDKRLEHWYLTNLLGNAYEIGLAAAQLSFGGVLSDFPSIRFCLAHGGGVTAAVSGRWQRGYETQRPGVPARVAPMELLRQLYVDSVAFSDRYLEVAIEVFGPDHVVLGSDWPFPMGSYSAEHAGTFGLAAGRALNLLLQSDGGLTGHASI